MATNISGNLTVSGNILAGGMVQCQMAQQLSLTPNITNVNNVSEKYNTTNGKITFSNNSLTVHSGVNYIKVTSVMEFRQKSSQTVFSNIIGINRNGDYLDINGLQISQTCYGTSYPRKSTTNIAIIKVQENDVIRFRAISSNSDTSGGYNTQDYIETAGTHFTLEIVG